uniref:Uncharacterized protein n=1 Tax=Ditylenchus dipsaci TaxID=166011 RepID=A0A915DDH4_9BILA
MNNSAVYHPHPPRPKEQSNGINKTNGNKVGKRKKPDNFVMHGYEPPQNKQKIASPYLMNNGDGRSRAVEQIELYYDVSATKCFLRWNIPLELRVHHQELEVETSPTRVSRARLGLVNEYVVFTVPGQTYNVELFILDAIGNILVTGQCSFRATFSKEEMHNLYEMAVKFAGDMLHPYKNLYRCKPKRYYDSIYHVEGRIMKPYLKDNNGQSACPINGVLHGLFFSARLKDNGQLPHSSPFGEVRMQVPVEKLLNGDKVNMYFSDFYCNKKMHYVTLVICKKGSDSDRFCRDHLLLLSPTNNNFLKVVEGQNGKSFCVNLKVWVEIYYTEEISLFEAAKFDQIETIGRGYSKEDGLPHNKSCLECNLYPRNIPILSQVAREILCIQGSSGESERAFHVMGIVATDLRNRLTPNKLSSRKKSSQEFL